MNDRKKSGAFINARSFIAALVIIAALMILGYISTLLLPCDGIPFWKWLLSPALVLFSDDSVTLIAVIVFLLVIGGVFNALTDNGVMRYMVDKIAFKYGARRYKLMAVVMFFFMALGSLIGSFEEVVPMVPIVVALAVRLGWDPLTGLAMSLLSVGCGFAAGIFNPFTVGVAQEIAGLPMFSGAWFRAINFAFIYLLLLWFTRSHAKKVDGGVRAVVGEDFAADRGKDRGVLLFAAIMAVGIAAVMSSALITALRDYTFVIVSVMFLVAGVAACLGAGMRPGAFARSFGRGLVSILPAVLMILMASSIKFTLETAGVLELIISAAIGAASALPRWAIILFIYLLALIMNFFIASGSAKAIMLTPLLVPLAEPFGISAQLVIVAYAFGDGFSNTFYPTNPALLISLGLADTSYSDWVKYSWSFQLLNLALTSCLLLLGLATGLS